VTGKQRGNGQRPVPPELPSTSYAVLGLLSGDRELSGYDLRSQRIEARGELRARRLYRITPAGLEALRTWVRTAPVESTVLKHSVALRVWLGHLIGLSSVHEIVAKHVVATEELLSDIRRAHDTAPPDSTTAYAKAILEWAQEMHVAEIAAFERLEAKLKRARPALPAKAS
jgi:DNA-binding PadR family transcriptional regulator